MTIPRSLKRFLIMDSSDTRDSRARCSPTESGLDFTTRAVSGARDTRCLRINCRLVPRAPRCERMIFDTEAGRTGDIKNKRRGGW